MRNRNLVRLAVMALMCAISIVLIYFIHLPIFPSAPYLEYDPADVPILISAFLFGPWWGLLVLLAAAGIQALTVSAPSGIIGLIMHFIATGIYILAAALISRGKTDAKHMVLGLLAGALAATAVMIPLNLIFTPLFGTPLDIVKGLIWPVIVPFNLIKFGINSVLSGILSSALIPAARRMME